MRFLQLAAVALAGCAAAPASVTGLALEPCQLAHPSLPGTLAAECGVFPVPEARSRPGGRVVLLKVAVVRAPSAAVAADAVVFLAGGPGQAATEQVVPLAAALERATRARDLLLVDQRGTGGSGRLACAEEATTFMDAAAERAYLERCAGAQTADLTEYTSAAYAHDLDAVRAALGYAALDLVGVSYGTRAALTYAKLYPARTRTLVLDGVAPLDWAIGDGADENAQSALDALLARCEREPACAGAFPRLRASLVGLIARLERRPERLVIPDPRTAAPRALTMTADLVRRTLFLMSYSTEAVGLVPLLVHDAHANGRLEPLAAQALLMSGELERGMSLPLQLAALCAEDFTFAKAKPGRAYLGGSLARGYDVCSFWPHARLDGAHKAPLVSDVPALLLSGGADPVTTPAHGERAAKSLRNSRHLVVGDVGHGTLFRGCLPRLVAEVIEGASVAALDASCVVKVRPTPFFVDFAGPMP